MESYIKEGDNPVHESNAPITSQVIMNLNLHLCELSFIVFNSSRAGHEKSCLNLGGPPPKAKYVL